MKKIKLVSALLLSSFSGMIWANDITGLWKNIDDKTGSSKAVLEIRQESNGSYTAKIIKVTPRPGYTPKETCVSCPAPYTNKPILGLDVLTGLKADGENNYVGGKILDPLSGKIYSTKARLSPNGKRITLRGYVGVSALGRSQTWIRHD
ncbi:DUF2147 domain-containing protein [Acinetobacter bohemicus]|uniref:DUF2147 domain-containing protein n=1 Tax=Acinetobacter lwoffii TaxID=28090 RepID=A0A9D2UT00_ACILW|nr:MULTISPECIES: DUF2147 domain-containing protein [Acinetobacter]MDM1782143.1 DUF2147 domain-containing protein [Acinetobacter indicus]HJF28134.1 DUF2147 domain-containing protein [Acinetobacter lwoffii]MCO8042660.1 DUF2147 domain-containing protein [Acinetobacter sp. S4400-12]MCO8045797.1 DUF2147 domain-containing protein [Acinetobacter sp. S4397-1]MCU7224949.1 DUF2147 domain-containing protein [Acinetobacter bohemicus]